MYPHLLIYYYSKRFVTHVLWASFSWRWVLPGVRCKTCLGCCCHLGTVCTPDVRGTLQICQRRNHSSEWSLWFKKTDSYYIPRYKCPSKRLFSIQQPQPCTAEETWEIKYIIIIIYRRCYFLKTYSVKSIFPYYRSIIFFKYVIYFYAEIYWFRIIDYYSYL